jgi:hypothetical protein
VCITELYVEQIHKQMDIHHEHHGSLIHKLEKELYMFYKRENHTIGNYLFLYWAIAIGILGLVFIAELLFK